MEHQTTGYFKIVCCATEKNNEMTKALAHIEANFLREVAKLSEENDHQVKIEFLSGNHYELIKKDGTA